MLKDQNNSLVKYLFNQYSVEYFVLLLFVSALFACFPNLGTRSTRVRNWSSGRTSPMIVPFDRFPLFKTYREVEDSGNGPRSILDPETDWFIWGTISKRWTYVKKRLPSPWMNPGRVSTIRKISLRSTTAWPGHGFKSQKTVEDKRYYSPFIPLVGHSWSASKFTITASLFPKELADVGGKALIVWGGRISCGKK